MNPGGRPGLNGDDDMNGGGAMGKVRFDISISLDGYSAGPDQRLDQPLGDGGEQLHEWVLGLAAWREPHGLEGGETTASSELLTESLAAIGAYVMGRNMFGGGEGAWDESWEGWWGDDPPFHVPVFVVTHHPRAPLAKEGGTTFTFVTEGVEAAIEQARAAAGEKDVLIAGGANVIQQALAAGLVDEFQVNVAPVLLGGGVRLFEGIGPQQVGALEQARVVGGTGVAHLAYRVAR
jgi:dihydrofolate reductase